MMMDCLLACYILCTLRSKSKLQAKPVLLARAPLHPYILAPEKTEINMWVNRYREVKNRIVKIVRSSHGLIRLIR
ncbi:hypothetical protein BJY04DRAFT_94065 [Aspergillus karnatakaensis]|uniref:uncharacterized protein n=1 Tax=Aspergillus karnatakaensis TaxID=1810916 RepID=UPI003CCE4A1C